MVKRWGGASGGKAFHYGCKAYPGCNGVRAAPDRGGSTIVASSPSIAAAAGEVEAVHGGSLTERQIVPKRHTSRSR